MDCEIEIPDLFMGEDATLRVSFTIDDFGSPAAGQFGRPEDYDPGSDPEWTIYDIGITLHLENGDGAEWMLDGKQFRLIANSGDVVNAILEQIAEEAECRPYRRGRRNYWSAA